LRLNKRRHLHNEHNNNVWVAGFSAMTVTHKYHTVEITTGSVSWEVAIEVPVPLLPIPDVSLPVLINPLNWTHNELAVPLAQCSFTSYMTPNTFLSGKKVKSFIVHTVSVVLMRFSRKRLPCLIGGTSAINMATSSTGLTCVAQRFWQMGAAQAVTP
jgi:hypothetical protein